VPHDQQSIEQAKRDCRHDKQIHRPRSPWQNAFAERLIGSAPNQAREWNNRTSTDQTRLQASLISRKHCAIRPHLPAGLGFRTGTPEIGDQDAREMAGHRLGEQHAPSHGAGGSRLRIAGPVGPAGRARLHLWVRGDRSDSPPGPAGSWLIERFRSQVTPEQKKLALRRPTKPATLRREQPQGRRKSRK
jgi:hypothetical protein